MAFPSSFAIGARRAEPVSAPLFQSALQTERRDAPAGIGGNPVIQPGDRFNGTISSASDSDTIAIRLEAGQEYTFFVTPRTARTGLLDPELALFDARGGLLAESFDLRPPNPQFFDPGHTLPAIRFTAETTGTYYLRVDGGLLQDSSGQFINAPSTGTYTLHASPSTFTIPQVVTMLTQFGWGIPVTLRHGERARGEITFNIEGLTPEGRKLALWALEAWADVTGHVYRRVTTANAEIMFDDAQPGAFAGARQYLLGTGEILTAFVNIGADWLAEFGTTIDSFAFETYVHEIGHALGLSHPGGYDGSAVFAEDHLFRNDHVRTTIMSYFTPWLEPGGEQFANPYATGSPGTVVTPMIADIAAIRALYGPATLNAGNTVYGANSNVGGWLDSLFAIIFDGAPHSPGFYNGGNVLMTVADTAGIDTFDFSTKAENQIIDLREGGVSSVAGFDGNLVVALGSVIERAIGGSGADVITGNAAANLLEGRAGNDRIDGGAGNDSLLGGEGSDSLIGGIGRDTLRGDIGNDSLDGGGDADLLEAGAGDDLLLGALGNDTLLGGDGADRLIGGAGRDSMTGGLGADTFVFLDLSDSTASTRDRITDFQSGQDRIDLSAMDANLSLAGDQAFTSRGTAAFGGQAGELRWQSSGANAFLVSVDLNGDRRADMSFTVAGTSTLAATDFIL